MKNLFSFKRRQTLTATIGKLQIGSAHNIASQSMTSRSTLDTDGCTDQIEKIEAAGGKLARLTAIGKTEALNLQNIKEKLALNNSQIPLCADIHFNAELAFIAAQIVDKVRVNPGNFAKKEDVETKLIKLIEICKTYKTALRIGSNHGSLAPDIIEQYGDTPKGIVESALEFIRICHKNKFHNLVVSLKSSNPRIMVESYRLAAQQMELEGLRYPLHIGVTEAGEGIDGRIRSAVGIGALLSDGLGDTIRVSLTEPPENEIPVAETLINHFANLTPQNYIPVNHENLPYNPLVFAKRQNALKPIVVGENADPTQGDFQTGSEDWFYVTLDDLTENTLETIAENNTIPIVLSSENPYWVGEIRAAIVHLMRYNITNRIILYRNYNSENYPILAAADMGAILIDGLAEGIWVDYNNSRTPANIALSILQATRLRLSTTEIISCPSCGRTKYDIATTVRNVKARLSGYVGLKIAVMGCVVNGPGEMADADYGYIGCGEGLVALYKGRNVVERAVPEKDAIDKLEALIINDIKSKID